MPTYGYRCPKCSTEFDVWERMADPPNGTCPECGAKGTRLFFPAGIVFKGSGFYKTDSRSSDGGSAAHRASPPPSGDGKEKDKAAKGDPQPSAGESSKPDSAGAPSAASAGSPDGPSTPSRKKPSTPESSR